MISLALYRSYIFDLFRYPSHYQIDYTLLLSHNLRSCPTPPLFFNQLLHLHQRGLLTLTPELVDQFTAIAEFNMEGLDEYKWFEIPEFFNKSGEFYQLTYMNYAAAFVTHFQMEMANCNSTAIQHTYLFEFYHDSALLINELANITPNNNDESFIHQTVVITLISIYLTIRTRYSYLTVNTVLNNSEIVSRLLPNYKSECDVEYTTAYYLKLLFTKASLMFSVDMVADEDSTKPPLIDIHGTKIKRYSLKAGESKSDRLNVTECADFLNSTTKTVRRYTIDNRLKIYVDGTKKYYLRGELLDFKNKMQQ